MSKQQDNTSRLTVPGAGDISVRLEGAGDVCVILGHGAGADMDHAHMQALSDLLVGLGMQTLRFNFPYMERGGGRTDKPETCAVVYRALHEHVFGTLAPVSVLLAGHSFGGRMASHYAVEPLTAVAGLIYFSFPLHPAGKPGTSRADHLPAINAPQLFLSGNRDKLAEPQLLEPVVDALPRATLHFIHTADHSWKPLKRTRTDPRTPYQEAADVIRDWLAISF